MRKQVNVIDKIKSDPLLSVGHKLAVDIEQTFPGTQALIVGGVVRDIVMGNEHHDVDIATNAPIDKIAERYHSADIGKSKDFGIVLVIFEGHEFEVAHFREEFGSADNRHPDEVRQVDDFKLDTARRDITINAMGIDVDGNVIDHQGGIEDIQKGIIRAVGVAGDRFKEDALRIFRIARFAARFGFEVESQTKYAMFESRDLTRNISIERIRDELIKIASVSGSAVVKFLDHLNEIRVLDIHLPEINGFHGFVHGVEHHPEGDLHAHTMAALNVSRSSDPLVNIAILFHDIGKTKTQQFNNEGKVSYKGHESVGADMFVEIGKRMKFSGDQIETIRFCIMNHMLAHRFDEMKKSKIVDFRQNKNYPLLVDVSRADDEARMHVFNEERFNRNVEKIEEIFVAFGEKKEFEERMKPLINGSMIMNLASDEGVKIEGKQVGKIKNAIREVVIERDFDITIQDTSRMVREMVKSGN